MKPTSTTVVNNQKQIDSLVIVRDTMTKQINQSKERVKTIEHWYEKARDSIIVQPLDSDIVFFANYLTRQFGSDNKDTTKTNESYIPRSSTLADGEQGAEQADKPAR